MHSQANLQMGVGDDSAACCNPTRKCISNFVFEVGDVNGMFHPLDSKTYSGFDNMFAVVLKIIGSNIITTYHIQQS